MMRGVYVLLGGDGVPTMVVIGDEVGDRDEITVEEYEKRGMEPPLAELPAV